MEQKTSMGKSGLRQRYCRQRAGLSPAQTAAYSEKINGLLMDFPLIQRAESICFYYPLGKEVNLLPSAVRALELGKQVYFPRTVGKDMEFYRVSSLAEFRVGNFHVMEPVGNEALGREEEALFLVPGVAFDRAGNRMGYGAGYYDRYFAELGTGEAAFRAEENPWRTEAGRENIPIKVGIAYGCQLAEELPAEDTDVPMDYILTEQGILTAGG